MRNILLIMSMFLLGGCSMMTTVGTVSVYTDTGEHFATYNARLGYQVLGANSSSPIKLGGILNFYNLDTGNYKLVSGGIIVCDYKTVADGYDVTDDDLKKNIGDSEYKLGALTLYSRFKENYENIKSLPKGSVVRCPISNVEFVKKSKSNNFYNNDCKWLYDACTNLDKYSRPADYEYIIDEYNKINKKYNYINR